MRSLRQLELENHFKLRYSNLSLEHLALKGIAETKDLTARRTADASRACSNRLGAE